MKDLREKDLREAWLASAEVPYGLLIPLLHDLGGAGEVYDALIRRKDLPQNLLPLEYRERLLELSGGERGQVCRGTDASGDLERDAAVSGGQRRQRDLQ